MRLCRFRSADRELVGFYRDDRIIPLPDATLAWEAATGRTVAESGNLLDYLPGGRFADPARELAAWLDTADVSQLAVPTGSIELLVPVPRPNKIFLLAGNFAEHVIERGYVPAERVETFPYVFMKPNTTLTHPGMPVKVPALAPDAVDWELELAVVIGKPAKNVSEADALNHVAGYTVLNDVTQRKFKPNPGRKPRERDKFFDWLHGKWFDTFCPCGPCVVSADAVSDPQALGMELTLNGAVKQSGSTGQMVFPVAAVIEFISRMVTLEPGDLISTGTPAGVGSASNTYLKPGDVMRGTIAGIGTLVTPVEAE
jgi:2-keto-4-pentenoate hydratase/2-oxohepta-3-ene-1,7-dioic acid hydratase in catechol pathway